MTALFDPSKDPKEVLADAQKAFNLPIGAASPLWLMFAGAASAGVAYWWLNRWRATTNLEAVLAAPQPEAALAVPEVVAPAVVEAFEAAADAVEEVVPEPVIEAAPEPVIETAPEPAIDAAPEPILEVAPTPKPVAKPKTKAAAVRAAPRTTSGPTRRA